MEWDEADSACPADLEADAVEVQVEAALVVDVAVAAALDTETECRSKEAEEEGRQRREHPWHRGQYLRPAAAGQPSLPIPVRTNDRQWGPAKGAEGIRRAADQGGFPCWVTTVYLFRMHTAVRS